MIKSFQRTIEDFICEHCGHDVKGNGYTNHCPECLWSKHVDKNPGDRAHQCKGLMRPQRVAERAGEYMITHVCEHCGFARNNLFGAGDNFDALLKIAKGV
jgi:hypothetical protein